MKNTKKILKLWLIIFMGLIGFVLIGAGLLWLYREHPKFISVAILTLIIAGITLYGAILIVIEEEK